MAVCWVVLSQGVQASCVGCLSVGGRRLGAWEAVAFGEPHVESALAVELFAGRPVNGAVATETSVDGACPSSVSAENALPWSRELYAPVSGSGTTTAGGNGSKPFHYPGIAMPSPSGGG